MEVEGGGVKAEPSVSHTERNERRRKHKKKLNRNTPAHKRTETHFIAHTSHTGQHVQHAIINGQKQSKQGVDADEKKTCISYYTQKPGRLIR